MRGTTGEVRMNSSATFSYGLSHMDTQMLADQLKHTYIGSVRAPGATKRTYQERWTIAMDSVRESGNSVLSI